MHFYLKSSHGIKFTPGVSLLNFNFIQTVTQNRTIPSSLKILTSVRSLDPDLVSLILHYTNYLSGPDSPNIIIIIIDLQISYIDIMILQPTYAYTYTIHELITV